MLGQELSKLLKESDLQDIMRRTGIPGLSAAYVSGDNISHLEIGVSDFGLKVQSRTLFGAASLSKPVFAYIVLKLAQEGKINLDKSLEEMSGKDESWSRRVEADGLSKITPRMILSHRTGLPITAGDEGALNFQFEPGTKYGYSGVAIQCLQEAIENETGESLELLAKQYVFSPLKMGNSSFVDSNGNQAAANSLRTTATDYARFIQAWMNDESLMAAFQFDQDFSMKRDPWAVGLQSIENDDIDLMAIKNHDLASLSWGLGLGLQKNSDGSITAFHSGDMDHWRALVAFNITHKTGVVLFTNSKNGLALADEITSKTVGLEQGLNYLFGKYGFERHFREGWEEREKNRYKTICGTFPPHKPFPEALVSPASAYEPSQRTLLLSTPSSRPSAFNKSDSTIEQLLHRAKSMGLDPQKLLRSEGIDIEQKDNFIELQRLAQNGDKMANLLYETAAENIQNRSKLASKHLESSKNPLQIKNTKDKG